jgi:hypothetical protein
VQNYQYLMVPVEFIPGPPGIGNGAQNIEELLLKTKVSEDYA